MAKKVTGGGLSNILDNTNVVTPNITSFVQDENNGGLINPTQHLVESGLDEAKTPQEAQSVVQAGNLFNNTIQQSKNLLQQENEISKNAVNSLSKLTLDDWRNRPPQFSGNDLDMGLFNSFANLPDSQRQAAIDEFRKSINDDKKSAVEPAIEALGVHDYFPSIGFNINVGSYSGKVLGNVPIFVAGGGQLPFGVMDARKRALEKQAKEKAVLADKLKNLNIDTSPQYQMQFDEMVMKTHESYLKDAGYDALALTNGKTQLSRGYLNDVRRLETASKEIMYVDEIAKKIKQDLKDGRTVPVDTINLLTGWEAGKLNLEDFIKEGGKMPQIAQQLKSYDNITQRTDELAKQITTNDAGMTIRPLDPNKMTTDSDYLTKAADVFKYSKGQGYDKYMSLLGTYYDTKKLNDLVEHEWENNNFYRGLSQKENDELKGEFASLLASKIGSKIEPDLKTVANDRAEMAKLAWDKEKYAKESVQYYDELDKVSLDAGKSAQDRISLRASQIGRPLKNNEKSYIYADEYTKRNLPLSVDKNGNWIHEFATYEIPITKQKGKDGKEQQNVMNTDRYRVRIPVIYKGVKKDVSLDDFLKYGKNYVNPKTKGSFSDPDYDYVREVSKMATIPLQMETQYGYDAIYDESTKIAYPADRTDKQGKRQTIITTTGRVSLGKSAQAAKPSTGSSTTEKVKGGDFSAAKTGGGKASNLEFKVSVNGSSQFEQSTLGTTKEEDTRQLSKIPEYSNNYLKVK